MSKIIQVGPLLPTHRGPTPPTPPSLGQAWEDTSVDPSVYMYWDGDSWLRMDGGGSVPEGHITEAMLSLELKRKLGL